MRTLIRFLALLFLTLLPASTVAGPLEDGVKAYHQQDYQAALNLLQPLADQGNAQAETLIGVMCLGNRGIPEDLPAGLQWLRKAAEQGDVEAQTELAIAFQDGHGVTQDYAQAMKWFLKASDQGDSYAQFSIGQLYTNGQGVPKDPVEAMKWHKKAHRPSQLPKEVGQALDATSSITLYSLQPWGGPDIPEWDFHHHHVLGHRELLQDQAKIAIKALHDAVSEGEANWHSGCLINPRHALRFKTEGDTYDILICYQCGQLEIFKNDLPLEFNSTIGGNPEVLNGLLKAANIPLADGRAALNESYREEAKAAFKKAEDGDVSAQEVLARMLISGRGVKKDEAEGIKWLAKSLSSPPDNPEFQITLGNIYKHDRDFTRNYPEAMRLFQKAAAQGSIEAQYQIGELYERGEGVAKSSAEAIKRFRQAAENGIADAQFEIGVRYAQGEDLPQDYPEALKWLQKAADQGHPGALCWIGTMYENGWGVSKDPVEAYFWDRLGEEYGQMEGTRVSVRLTPEQFAAVTKRKAAWTAAHPKRP